MFFLFLSKDDWTRFIREHFGEGPLFLSRGEGRSHHTFVPVLSFLLLLVRTVTVEALTPGQVGVLGG